jgi:hypothetical protein
MIISQHGRQKRSVQSTEDSPSPSTMATKFNAPSCTSSNMNAASSGSGEHPGPSVSNYPIPFSIISAASDSPVASHETTAPVSLSWTLRRWYISLTLRSPNVGIPRVDHDWTQILPSSRAGAAGTGAGGAGTAAAWTCTRAPSTPFPKIGLLALLLASFDEGLRAAGTTWRSSRSVNVKSKAPMVRRVLLEGQLPVIDCNMSVRQTCQGG